MNKVSSSAHSAFRTKVLAVKASHMQKRPVIVLELRLRLCKVQNLVKVSMATASSLHGIVAIDMALENLVR